MATSLAIRSSLAISILKAKIKKMIYILIMKWIFIRYLLMNFFPMLDHHLLMNFFPMLDRHLLINFFPMLDRHLLMNFFPMLDHYLLLVIICR